MRAMTWRLWVTLSAIALVCVLWLIAAGGLLWAVLDPSDFQTIVTAMDGRWGLLFFLWAGSMVPIYSALRWAMHRYLVAPERLADAVDIRLKQHRSDPIESIAIPHMDRLVQLFNALLARNQVSVKALEQQVNQAVAQTENERAWLSTLLAELNRSVIVANNEGQILLYNNRARLQFKRLAEAENRGHGGELIGLGRSLDGIIDRSLLEHAKSTIERRIMRGDHQTSTQCLMQTPTGRTYRIHISPVRRQGASSTVMEGMILVIDNITDEVKLKQEHAESLQTLAQLATRQTEQLAGVQKALRDGAPVNTSPTIEDQLEDMHASAAWLAQNLATLPKRTLKPFPLEDLSAQDWVEAIQHALQGDAALGREVRFASTDRLADVWLRVDGMSLVRAVVALLDALDDHPSIRAITVDAGIDDHEVVVNIDFSRTQEDTGDDTSLDDWLASVVDNPSLGANALGQTIAEVIAYHGGRWSLTAGRVAICLPRIPPVDALPETLTQRHDSRPEYYDFHLFDAAIAQMPQADSPLTTLSFTVFDTETTGLNPSQGDEIIQLGAVRVVNGRILSTEVFDQLIDPKRAIPTTSTAIHGIAQADVDGQPDIHTVLPTFHRFCEGTVLVAHNADFDLQCLALKAPACGVAFDHPTLDTLLLSALAHPYQDSHNLDDLARRLGVAVEGRHRALSDAQMTAQILVKLLPILEERGIKTLAQALQAQRSLWQKRASY